MLGILLTPFTNVKGITTLVDPVDMMRESTLTFCNETHAMLASLKTTLSESNKLFRNKVKAMSSSLTTTEALSKRQIKSSQLLNKEIRVLSGQLKSNTACE
jgi:hypothetical protein